MNRPKRGGNHGGSRSGHRQPLASPPAHLVNSTYGSTFLEYATTMSAVTETRDEIIPLARNLVKKAKDIISFLHRISFSTTLDFEGHLHAARELLAEIHIEFLALIPFILNIDWKKFILEDIPTENFQSVVIKSEDKTIVTTTDTTTDTAADTATTTAATTYIYSPPELKGDSRQYFQFQNSFLFCFEEYIEAFSFWYFLSKKSLISLQYITQEINSDIIKHLTSLSMQNILIKYPIPQKIENEEKLKEETMQQTQTGVGAGKVGEGEGEGEGEEKIEIETGTMTRIEIERDRNTNITTTVTTAADIINEIHIQPISSTQTEPPTPHINYDSCEILIHTILINTINNKPFIPILLPTYIDGLLDLPGEIMRCVMNTTITPTWVRLQLDFLRELSLYLLDTCQGRSYVLDIQRSKLSQKLRVLKDSVEKVEKVAYRWNIREAEFPDFTPEEIREMMNFKEQNQIADDQEQQNLAMIDF